jgi:hypothetical protein
VTRRRTAALRVGAVLVGVLLAGSSQSSAGTAATGTASAPAQPAVLTNLAHLDFLRTQVAPPAQVGHTTYQLARRPAVGMLWTYAEPLPGGGYRRLGGGAYDPATDTYGQGAFNADDVSRAAVVYLRHWKATGAASSRRAAAELLRGLTYLQTASGPDAGNVVLWMQPDGTLNPSADPVEQPDPSDSGPAYWLARTVWALGEGYAAFRAQDPGFARFLAGRLDLAVAALDRQVLDRYGQFLDIDGQRAPAWLVVDGADASAEAVLGLSAYVAAGGPAAARTALSELSDGIAMLAGGDAGHWPFGAVRPWALSRSDWHAWASQMPAALVAAGSTLHRPELVRLAAVDSGTFDPWLITSGGPDNGRLPTPVDRSQIAYGVDSRIESLLATAAATGAVGPRRVAGIVAAWFFGANAAGVPAYDPSTGRTVDGIGPDGTVNRNAGAESTIHGLLAMLALDAHPDVARLARTATVVGRTGSDVVQAEDARLTGRAAAVAPPSLWTGESQYGGTGYAELGDGGTATFTLAAGPARVLMPVLDLRPGSSAVTTFRWGARVLGRVRSGDVGPQGDSPAPGALLPVSLPVTLPPGATRVTASTVASGGDTAVVDALVLEPVVSDQVLGGAGHGTALLRNALPVPQRSTLPVPGGGRATVEVFDGQGRLRAATSSSPGRGGIAVDLLPGGFTVVRR